MLRDPARLASRTFDVLVVGGGIYGLTIAYDAAQRGLDVALIDQADFGGGASFNHLRTLHGGLRYLQTLNIARARESVRERRAIARIAPHAVQPQLFALPLFHSLAKGTFAMRAGFALDRLVARDRNVGVQAPLRLPAGRVISQREAIGRFPELRQEGLAGAAVWYDYITPESDRLTIAFATAAAAHGAVLANYLEAAMLIVDGRRVAGVRALDRQSGHAMEIAARVTVNATGGAIDRLLGSIGRPTRIPMLTAMNLVTRREAGEYAIGGRSRSGRHLFMVPWRRRALFGTWESGHACQPGVTGVSDAEVATFIGDLNDAFPSMNLTRDDVTLVHRGVVPAIAGPDGHLALEGHERIRDHAVAGGPDNFDGLAGLDGLISVAGAKYTTARAVAERVTTMVFGKLQRDVVPCRTATAPLLGESAGDTASSVTRAVHGPTELPTGTLSHLAAAYGPHYRDVLSLAADRPDWRTLLADDSPVIGAQLVWAVRQEMAVTLCDTVVRRTPLGALGFPGDAAAARASDLVGGELGWSEERRREEVATLRRFYAPA